MEDNTRTFGPGGTVFKEGDPGDLMYILVSGSVELRKKVEGGETVLKTVDTPNEFFGEMALIDHAPRSASAVAVNETKLLAIDERVFESMILTNPKFALTIVKVLTARIRTANRQVSDLTETDAKERISRAFADCAVKTGEKIFDGGIKVRIADLREWTNTKTGVSETDFDAWLYKTIKVGTIRWAATSGETKEHVVLPETFIKEYDRRGSK